MGTLGWRKPVSPGLAARIVKMRAASVPLREIAAAVGRGIRVVHAVLEQAGIPRPGQGGRRGSVPPPDAAEMARLYREEHLSVRQIGERFGRAYTTTRNTLLRAGVTLRTIEQGQQQHPNRRHDAQQ